MNVRLHRLVLALLAIFTCVQTVLAAKNHTNHDGGGSGNGNSTSGGVVSNGTQWIPWTNSAGEVIYLNNDRQPALYTGNYGDCLGNSLINFTRFDAAFYRDNMTVLFHLDGTTAVANESLVLYISVYAYGESRFTFLFDPCKANIPTLCPLNSSVPVQAQGIIPVTDLEANTIPSLAFTIPDFEGQAVLRVFANSTQSEIGCYSAVLTNGKSFSQPETVGSVLGFFAFVAMCGSFATAIYGGAVPTMRLHYAHSMSVGVVFAVFQHIFFTGALSLNWPPVLVAWWSNFAWAGGMIKTTAMQDSINKFIGNNFGSTAEVGAAPAGSTQNDVGGTPDISEIYKRSLTMGLDVSKRLASNVLVRRETDNSAEYAGYKWHGDLVGPNMPLPGNYSGFAGTLSLESLPVSNAFMTGFLWFLILLACIMAAVVMFKAVIEFLALIRLVNNERLRYFRDHWLGFTAVVGLRAFYLGWFAVMFLAIFQFTFSSSGGVKGVAALAFLVFFIVNVGAAFSAYHYYGANVIGGGSSATGERKKLLDVLSWTNTAGNYVNVHDNVQYTTRFGWLSSRFRRSKWWFFNAWLAYDFLRACFYGGAAENPLAQVFGLLVLELLALGFVVWNYPYEGRRLNILVVYCLGFSKVMTLALSAVFVTEFSIDRIAGTVVGIVIIVIQGLLTVVTLIAIAVGAISSWMSVSRNRDNFRPRRLAYRRERYFNHLDQAVEDRPQSIPRRSLLEILHLSRSKPKQPYFEMRGVTRMAKIEDEDEEFVREIAVPEPIPTKRGPNEIGVAISSPSSSAPRPKSRTGSVRSTQSNSNLPFGARQHRASWSSHDYVPRNPANLPRVPPLPRNISSSRSSQTASPVPSAATINQTHLHSRSQNPRTSQRASSSNLSHSASQAPPQPPITSPQPVLHIALSAASLRVGGDVSSRSNIGAVPEPPAARPRSGPPSAAVNLSRNSSYASSRTASLTSGDYPSSPVAASAGPRPLTPTQEYDE